MSTEFHSTALSDEHNLATFECGIESPNIWLTEHTRCAQQAGTARTFAWVTDHEPGKVCAYYSLECSTPGTTMVADRSGIE